MAAAAMGPITAPAIHALLPDSESWVTGADGDVVVAITGADGDVVVAFAATLVRGVVAVALVKVRAGTIDPYTLPYFLMTDMAETTLL